MDLILNENGYTKQKAPRAGDLVIYRSSGAVTHTAVVQYVSGNQPVLVSGKWGPLGVFLHPIDKSPYGTDYAFYRSPCGPPSHQPVTRDRGQDRPIDGLRVNGLFHPLRRYHLQANETGDQSAQEDHAPEGRGILEPDDADERSPECADARPDGISRAERDLLCREREQPKANDGEQEKGDRPAEFGKPFGEFETGREATLE